MADAQVLPQDGGESYSESVFDSEDRTELASQSELDARLRRFQGEHAVQLAPRKPPVPLEDLRVDDSHHQRGIRLLVRDLTNSRSVSPGSDTSVRWLALRAEVASSEEPEHQVLAVTQTHKDIKFTVRIPGELLERPPIWCDLYYDPASDNQILRNRSEEPISLVRISKASAGNGHGRDPSQSPGRSPDHPKLHRINPYGAKALSPGTWKITVRDIPVLDFRILEKRPFTVAPGPVIGKRSFSEYEGGAGASDKKPRADASPDADKNDGVIMFLRETADPLVFPLPHGTEKDRAAAPSSKQQQQLSAVLAQPLLGIDEDQTVNIPGECEIDGYQVTKRKSIADSVLSSVYTADYSRRAPDELITVKVLKTKAPPGSRSQDVEGNLIRQADMWLREYQTQDDLKHDSIVKLYGGDARFLSLYMEHVDAKDLSSKARWRSTADENFLGGRLDAVRILHDVSGALQYLHDRELVHNDIKPGNILYAPERGAMLCDFGLTTFKSNTLTTGGTPYYIPPEFIGNRQRGPPSDVWALGIVMLYLLGKIPFPEARGSRRHPKQLYWQIADVNRGLARAAAANSPTALQQQQDGPAGRPAPVATARMQMQLWLGEIREAKDRLDPRDWLDRLVVEMLVPNPRVRITMERLHAEVAKHLSEKQAAVARRAGHARNDGLARRVLGATGEDNTCASTRDSVF